MIVCLSFEEKADLVGEDKRGRQVRQGKERTKKKNHRGRRRCNSQCRQLDYLAACGALTHGILNGRLRLLLLSRSNDGFTLSLCGARRRGRGLRRGKSRRAGVSNVGRRESRLGGVLSTRGLEGEARLALSLGRHGCDSSATSCDNLGSVEVMFGWERREEKVLR